MEGADPGRRAVVYIYAREPSAAPGYALLQQHARAWAVHNGFTVIRAVMDVTDRSELRELLAQMAEGRLDALAVPHMETLGGGVGTVTLVAVKQAGGYLLAAKERLVSRGKLLIADPGVGTRAGQASRNARPCGTGASGA